MSKPIVILVGTMSGNAELTAEELAIDLKRAGRSVRILRMERADLGVFDGSATLLVCTSTYGKGEVPDNGKALFAKLEAERPNLSAVQYGVVGLGDYTHVGTVCFGALKFDALLAGLGATRLGELCLHDGSRAGMPEDTARQWLPDWLQLLGQAGL